MRGASSVVLMTGLGLCLLRGPANAAIQINIAAPSAATCNAGQPGCNAVRNTVAAPAKAAASGSPVPPAAIAGLVGLAALALAFRPRRSGLPEVSS